MKRIEQLINMGENKDRIEDLSAAVRNRRLVIFFGAGLSLWETYKKWAYPFVKAQERAYEDLGALKKYLDQYEENPQTTLQIHKIEELLSEGEQLKTDNKYLNWGDKLDEVFEKLKSINDRTVQKEKYYIPGFNEACVLAFQEEGDPPEFKTPYGIPAIYFLPYLSGLLVTTNVDTSFERVCKETGNENWFKQAVLPRTKFDINQWNSPSHSIHYIHGHINDPASLVMTEKEYSKMYPTELDSFGKFQGSRKILNTLIENYSILFLGASLQEDITVRIINHESSNEPAKSSRERNNLRFFPVCGFGADGQLEQPPQINDCDVVVIDKGAFEEIPILLLHLIRKTTDFQSCCTWQRPKVNGDSDAVSSETRKRIQESLIRDAEFERIDICEEDCEHPYDTIHYLFDHHSIEKHDSDLGWSICTVQTSEFSLEGGQPSKSVVFSPLHNYPIGDTIYVLIGSKSLDSDDNDAIVKSIEQWARGGEKDANGDEKQKCREIISKVRVICFPFDPVRDYGPRTWEAILKTVNKVYKRVVIDSSGESDSPFLKMESQLQFDKAVALIYRHVFDQACDESKENTKDITDESRNDNTEDHSFTRTLSQ